MSTAAAATANRIVRVTRKQILSLFGVVPLGVYVVLHLWTNLSSLNPANVTAAVGQAPFDQALEASRNNPAFLLLEIFGLGLPLLGHTVFGIMELFRARPNNTAYNTFDNFKFVLQRLSAIGLALFIPAHVINARIMPAFSAEAAEFIVNHHETWQGMHHEFTGQSPPITLIVYVLGLLGVSYHLANGLYTAGVRWGLAVSPGGRARLQIFSGTAFVILLGMSYVALYGFMQG